MVKWELRAVRLMQPKCLQLTTHIKSHNFSLFIPFSFEDVVQLKLAVRAATFVIKFHWIVNALFVMRIFNENFVYFCGQFVFNARNF